MLNLFKDTMYDVHSIYADQETREHHPNLGEYRKR